MVGSTLLGCDIAVAQGELTGQDLVCGLGRKSRFAQDAVVLTFARGLNRLDRRGARPRVSERVRWRVIESSRDPKRGPHPWCKAGPRVRE